MQADCKEVPGLLIQGELSATASICNEEFTRIAHENAPSKTGLMQLHWIPK
jgi:hypothetical protein